MEIQMELWSLMNFQDYMFNDDRVSFYLRYFVAEAAGLQASIKFWWKRSSRGEDMYLILDQLSRIDPSWGF